MLLECGVGSPQEVEKAKADGAGLWGCSCAPCLDRGAAQQALAGFMAGRTLTANQITFLDLLIDNLTAAGVVDPSRQYEAPYTRFSAQAVEGVFKDAEVTLLVQVLEEVKLSAVA